MTLDACKRLSACLLAIILIPAMGGCGESATVLVENNWPQPLYPPVDPLIIDGIFLVDVTIDLPIQLLNAAYNYLGPADTLVPGEHRSVYVVPGGYDIFVRAFDPDPTIVNCYRIYVRENIALANTTTFTFAINDLTAFFYVGDGCPVAP
jgi:hypothetical protein